jgi:hypothetical protein
LAAIRPQGAFLKLTPPLTDRKWIAAVAMVRKSPGQ